MCEESQVPGSVERAWMKGRGRMSLGWGVWQSGRRSWSSQTADWIEPASAGREKLLELWARAVSIVGLYRLLGPAELGLLCLL